MEPLSVFNFDIYSQDLKLHSQGYDIYESEAIKILILRFKDMFKNLNLSLILSNFIGQKINFIVDSNKTGEKKNLVIFTRNFVLASSYL